MPSPRVQQQIDRLLDEAEQAMAVTDWVTVRQRCEAALALDPDNEDARFYVEAADRAGGVDPPAEPAGQEMATASAPPTDAAAAVAATEASEIQSFADGRYQVTKFLGEGGRKIVYLAKDTLLDRDVAFALIKTEGLDDAARERITREAQTMGRLGTHPNVVSVLDIGEHEGQPFVVIELLGGGDVEGLLEDAAGPLPLEQTLEIAKDSARGLDFIHSKSIVHRDMKPGNVWLTADGVAKIGDYGLALSGDKTRLTLEGTMVGTVDYMPPEQALGGEITPRSDLYSLGAMIYELVTGTVPFKGDRITEVVSQHINTAPELPSLRGAKIPPALEELILRLMAKDPDDRPESAAEVLQLLETIDPNDTSQLDADYLSQLAQGVFVGRSRELAELKQRFDEAVSGISRLVVLVGQPGIGKTRLARELETHARMRGARIYWGRAPEGGGAPPYWLFHQLLRGFLAANDELTARRQLGEEARALARIAPEIVAQLPGVVVDEAANEFAIHEAMRTFLNRLSRETPLLIVLDDLHWADEDSLAVLQHISRDLEPAPLMFLGTYRDTEMSRSHPLSQALATFNREPSFVRLQVRGLDREGGAEFVERSAGFEPSREQLDLFMRQTDGNPFFLAETVAAMLEAGTLDERTYALTTPDGVREALFRRVNELPDDAVELLKLAAIVGYEFDFATLSIISDFDDSQQVELIETALAEHVVSEGGRPGHYQFVYQPMQELLLDEMSSTRRLRLHGTIADQLQTSYGTRADEHAAELARHYAESAALNAEHVAPALRFSGLAGEQAEAARDWPAAEQTYTRALRVADASGQFGDLERAQLEAGLGRVYTRLGFIDRAREHLETAVDLFERLGDHAAMAATALSGFTPFATEDNVQLAIRTQAALSGTSEADSEARLLAWIALAFGNLEPGPASAVRARELAEARHLADVNGVLEQRASNLAAQAGDLPTAADCAERATALFLPGDPRLTWVRTMSARHTLFSGDLSAAERKLESVLDEARYEPSVLRVVQSWLGSIFILRWDLDALYRLLDEPGRPRSTLDSVHAPRLRAMRGQPAAGLAMQVRALGRPNTAAYGVALETAARAGLKCESGDEAGARADLASLDLDRWELAILADEALVRLGSPEQIRGVFDRAPTSSDASSGIRASQFGGYDRARATWAMALGEFEEAERAARTGLDWAQREHCPVEEGRSHQVLADLLDRRGETREAAVHLDAAGDLFSTTGARLYLDQVLERKDLLKA